MVNVPNVPVPIAAPTKDAVDFFHAIKAAIVARCVKQK